MSELTANFSKTYPSYSKGRSYPTPPNGKFSTTTPKIFTRFSDEAAGCVLYGNEPSNDRPDIYLDGSHDAANSFHVRSCPRRKTHRSRQERWQADCLRHNAIRHLRALAEDLSKENRHYRRLLAHL